ncbi:exodeoxyribonuclease III [archaeon]|nr:exodeoxyribonuclease III [archaeon]
MKLISWNVNGIRAVMKKGFAESIAKLDPDILCIQESKAHPEQVDELMHDYPHHYWNSAQKKGYAGTAVFSKHEPLNVTYGTKNKSTDEEDDEGRVLTLEFKEYFLVTVYTPNSGRGLKRLEFRQDWDKKFYAFLKELEKTKPVILCGDLNVAHTDIDLFHPKPNYNKTAGYTQVEIDGLQKYLDNGFVDTFRHFYPDKTHAYSYWSYMMNARAKNVGWRIDYFLVSEKFLPNVKKAEIHPTFFGSDHCPVSLEI